MAPTPSPASGYRSNGRPSAPAGAAPEGAPGAAPTGMRWRRWSNGRASGWKLGRERVVGAEELGGPRPLRVASLLGDEGAHVPRPHAKGLPVQVCAYCSAMQGDGDGADGFYVAWPCEILAFLREQRDRLDTPTATALLGALREIERWTSDPRARAACGRLVRSLERRG